MHKNIKIIGNTFNKYDGEAIYIKSTDNVFIKDNKFLNDNYLVTKDRTQIREFLNYKKTGIKEQ